MSNQDTLSLEIGKTYATRRGFNRITITQQNGQSLFPFLGDNGRCYSPCGHQVNNGTHYVPLHNDLVQEIKIH